MKKIIVLILITMTVIAYGAVCIHAFKNKTAETCNELASIVSNRDLNLEEVAKEYYFEDSAEMIDFLVKGGYLVYIPEFTYVGDDYVYTYSSRYTTKGTIVYNDALAMGVIEE